jgi:hypothetical protein
LEAAVPSPTREAPSVTACPVSPNLSAWGKLRLFMSRGDRLFWFGFGTGLPSLLGALIGFEQTDAHTLALATCIWLVLGFCSLRGQQWARWSAVVILASMGLLIGLVFTTVSLISNAIGETTSLKWNELPYLVSGLVLVLDAGILAFSESVGDFIARRRGIPVVKDWSQAAVTTKQDQKAQRPTRDELLTGRVQRKRMIGRGRRVTVLAVLLGWMISMGAVGFIWFTLHSDPHLFETHQTNMIAAAFVSAIFYIAILVWVFGILVVIYFILFVIPVVFALPFVLPFARRWRDPASFLILRPFNREQITKDLSRFLRDEFATFGHCYTLSDRQVRVPLHIRIPVVQGQLSFLNFRLHKIRRPRHIEDLVKAMRKRVRRNLNWCFSRTKLFPVTCCDPGWRACVGRLAEEVDVVVADLSSITENIVWELEFLRDAGAIAKTVFVVEEARLAEARQQLSQMTEPFRGMPLLAYGPGLATNQGGAGERIVGILCGEGTARNSLAPV